MDAAAGAAIESTAGAAAGGGAIAAAARMAGLPGAAPPALSVQCLSKSFGGAQVLRNVGLEVAPGEIHGLLGQNGSGKSTFVKVLAGALAPHPGSVVHLGGELVHLPLPAAQLRGHGVSFVHQNLGLIPSLTVLENLRIRSLTARGGWHIDWAAEKRAADAIVERLGLSIDPAARLDSLPQADRALIAIARAYEELRSRPAGRQFAGLLVLDEPTPFLPRAGVVQLFELMRRIAAQNAGVIFISHDVDEVREITDRATVLRDGVVVGRFSTAGVDREQIIESIVGRKVVPYRTGRRTFTGAPLAAITQLNGPLVRNVDISLHPGEIVGLTGLVGAGYEHVLQHLFGARSGARGRLNLGGASIDIGLLTPRVAMERRIALLPGDRQGASGIGSLSVVDNLFLPDIAQFFRRGRLRRGEMVEQARRIGAEFEVRPAAPLQRLSDLSGGNAQKILLAKWLKLKPLLLMLEEPTQGVDVGARRQLLRSIRDAADTGAAVLCASSDHEQLADFCDRVLVFSRGRIVRTLSGHELTKEIIGESCYATAD